MYKKIEELYKKQSPYNKIKKRFFWTYIIVVLFLLLFNIFNSSLLLLLTVITTIIIMKKICEKELNTKLHFKFDKKDTEGKFLDEIICDKENEMFKNFLRKNKMDNLQTVKCIMEHYRNLVKPKIVSDNFWSIIAITISILLAFVTKDGFDFKSFEKALPYLISFTFIILTILFSIKQFSEIRTFLKGEEGMYERLEVVFSELYVESLKEKDTPKKKTIKIRNKKSKNTLPEGATNRQKIIKNP